MPRTSQSEVYWRYKETIAYYLHFLQENILMCGKAALAK